MSEPTPAHPLDAGTQERTPNSDHLEGSGRSFMDTRPQTRNTSFNDNGIDDWIGTDIALVAGGSPQVGSGTLAGPTGYPSSEVRTEHQDCAAT